MDNTLLIILTTGKEDRGGKATLAYSMGVSALALGLPTKVFLTLNGTAWAYTGESEEVKIDGFDPLSELINEYLELGGEILACQPCQEFFCRALIRADAEVIKGVKTVGLTSVVEEALVSTTATF